MLSQPLSLRSRFGFNFYDVFVFLFTGIFGLICFYPLWYVFVGSLNPSPTKSVQTLALWPVNGISLDCYRVILVGKVFRRSILISVSKTLLGSTSSIILTAMMAYGVSKVNIKGMKLINFLVVFTMYFGGGLIPFFMLMVNLGLYNSYWVYIIPGLIGAWNFILMRNYFVSSSESALEESALIDGATEFSAFFYIVIPLSMPLLSALFLFTAVGHWNDYTTYLYFVNDNRLMPFIMVLRNLLVDPTVFASLKSGIDVTLMRPTVVATNLKMTTIVVAMLPIMLLYPFLQKNFTKGIMVGAVKE